MLEIRAGRRMEATKSNDAKGRKDEHGDPSRIAVPVPFLLVLGAMLTRALSGRRPRVADRGSPPGCVGPRGPTTGGQSWNACCCKELRLTCPSGNPGITGAGVSWEKSSGQQRLQL